MKANNREVSKRNVHLMDTSGKLVTATLWGNEVCALLPVPKQRFLCVKKYTPLSSKMGIVLRQTPRCWRIRGRKEVKDWFHSGVMFVTFF